MLALKPALGNCFRLFIALALALCAVVEARAVDSPPSAVEVDGASLVLNGSGIRQKFFMDIYQGALYLPARATKAEDVLAMKGTKRIHLNFQYKKVDRQKITDGWREGFSKNSPSAALPALNSRIEKFCAFFPSDALKGDTYTFDLLPGGTSRVSINGQLKGAIEGEDFQRALLLIWLGEAPPTEDLKQGMLGKAK